MDPGKKTLLIANTGRTKKRTKTRGQEKARVHLRPCARHAMPGDMDGVIAAAWAVFVPVLCVFLTGKLCSDLWFAESSIQMAAHRPGTGLIATAESRPAQRMRLSDRQRASRPTTEALGLLCQCRSVAARSKHPRHTQHGRRTSRIAFISLSARPGAGPTATPAQRYTRGQAPLKHAGVFRQTCHGYGLGPCFESFRNFLPAVTGEASRTRC